MLNPTPARAARLAAIVVCCAALVAPSASAASAAKKAVKKFKNATADAVDAFGQSAKALNKQLDAALDVVDLKLEQGNGSAVDVNSVFTALKDFQQNIAGVMEDATSAEYNAFGDIQSILDDGGITEADLPKDLRFGEGGVIDRYRQDVMAELDKALRAAEKRVLKTGKLFRKKADVGICVRLAPPQNLRENPGPYGTSFTALQHTISVLLSRRDLTAPPEAGVIYLYGRCYQSDTLNLQSFVSNGAAHNGSVSPSGNAWERTVLGASAGYHQFKLSAGGQTGGGAYGGISVP